MKKIKLSGINYNLKVIIDTINELLEELAKQGIIELEDDNNGGSEN